MGMEKIVFVMGVLALALWFSVGVWKELTTNKDPDLAGKTPGAKKAVKVIGILTMIFGSLATLSLIGYISMMQFASEEWIQSYGGIVQGIFGTVCAIAAPLFVAMTAIVIVENQRKNKGEMKDE